MRADLRECAKNARQVFEQVLFLSYGKIDTKGKCLYACILLKPLLTKFAGCSEVVIRGGDGNNDGWFKSSDGKQHGHYWVEAECQGARYVVDITADQFGEDACRVLELPAAGACYFPGNQSETDSHFQHARSMMY